MDMKKILTNLPNSYDDFVRFTMQCIEEVDGMEKVICDHLRNNPDSSANDITELVWSHLGIGQPLEIVDDNEPPQKARRKSRAGKVAAF